jgi:membrane-bound lytic murein transglycosylase F
VSWSAVNNILRERTGFQITILIVWGIIGYYVFSPVVTAHKYVTLQRIQKTGEITVVTRNTAHCYYLYRDQPMGFEYEMAQAFAEYLGVLSPLVHRLYPNGKPRSPFQMDTWKWRSKL